MKSLFVSFNVRLLDDLHGASMGFKWGHESGYWDEYSRNMLFYSHGDLFHTYILAFGWHSIFDDVFRVRLPWSGCLGWICMRRARPGLKCEHFLSFWWLVVDPALPCPAPYRSDVWLLWRLAAVTFGCCDVWLLWRLAAVTFGCGCCLLCTTLLSCEMTC